MLEVATQNPKFKPSNVKDIIPKYCGHSQAGLEELFADTEGAQYIQKNVVINERNQLDITATAAKVGAVIGEHYERAVHGLLRVQNNTYVITTSIGLNSDSEQYVFGHELGHILLFNSFFGLGYSELRGFRQRVLQEPDYHEYVEAFCDYFAGRVLDSVYPSVLPKRLPPLADTQVEQLRFEI